MNFLNRPTMDGRPMAVTLGQQRARQRDASEREQALIDARNDPAQREIARIREEHFQASRLQAAAEERARIIAALRVELDAADRRRAEIEGRLRAELEKDAGARKPAPITAAVAVETVAKVPDTIDAGVSTSLDDALSELEPVATRRRIR